MYNAYQPARQVVIVVVVVHITHGSVVLSITDVTQTPTHYTADIPSHLSASNRQAGMERKASNVNESHSNSTFDEPVSDCLTNPLFPL